MRPLINVGRRSRFNLATISFPLSPEIGTNTITHNVQKLKLIHAAQKKYETENTTKNWEKVKIIIIITDKKMIQVEFVSERLKNPVIVQPRFLSRNIKFTKKLRLEQKYFSIS